MVFLCCQKLTLIEKQSLFIYWPIRTNLLKIVQPWSLYALVCQ